MAGSRWRWWRAAVVTMVAAVVAGYIVMRAARVALTYDEALALYLYGRGTLLATFDFSAATNHWLATIGMKASAAAFGTTEWALRLPALLAAGLYLGAAAPTTSTRTGARCRPCVRWVSPASPQT